MKNKHHPHHSDDSQYAHDSHYQNSTNTHQLVPAAHSKQTGIKAKPSPDKVARKAYDIYLKEGCPPARDVQHWLEAEAQLLV
jgi:hypothetical protein